MLIDNYNEDEDNGLEGLIEQLRQLLVVIVPKTTKNARRRYFAPDPEDSVELWISSEHSGLEASYRATAIYNLLKSHKQALLRLPRAQVSCFDDTTIRHFT